MPLTSGVRLGPYEILTPLGAGGMGEVYKARDTRLDRTIAIKVLPELFAADPQFRERFDREARAISQLTHPHICTLHDIGEHEGSAFLVMELLDGETLAARLERGALPVSEALTTAIQIAEALTVAHRAGIVHRDLKPGNIFLVRTGGASSPPIAKLLDFGLAKTNAPVVGGAAGSMLPTVSPSLTVQGTILGTFQYMAPEQIEGEEADARTDLFAFGCVLYEMLTGRKAFEGKTRASLLGAIMHAEPPLVSSIQPISPRALDRVVRKCLAKDPDDRWQSARDLRDELKWIAESGASSVDALAGASARAGVSQIAGTSAIAGVSTIGGAAGSGVTPAGPGSAVPAMVPMVLPRPLWRRAMPLALSAIAAGLLVAGVTSYLGRKPSTPVAVTRFTITVPEGQPFTNVGRHFVALSPDGSRLVYVANLRLYLRSMSQVDVRPIPGTEAFQGVTEPVFSPDGQWIVFWSTADSTLKKIAITGGAAVTLCPADNPYGMSWGADGIIFGQRAKGILRISPNGGTLETLVPLKDGDLAHEPQMLPDGQHILFTLTTGVSPDRWDKAQIVVQSLTSGERKTLISGGADARYVPTGHIVYALNGSLFAVAFDARRLEVKGGPVPIIEGVKRPPVPGANTGAAQFSFSDNGSIVYVPGPASVTLDQMILGLGDRQGVVTPLKIQPAQFVAPRVSPDGKRVAFGTDDGKEAIVWIYDLSGATSMQRLTYGGNNRFPIWSSDGKRVAYQSDREGDRGIWWQLADGTGPAERLTKPEQNTSHVPDSWSPTEDVFLFDVLKGTDSSLWTFAVRDKKTAPFASVQSTVPTGAVFSPDGRWVAYTSADAHTTTIYVEPFPATGAKYQLVAKGTDAPHEVVWAPNGKELIYNPRVGGFEAVSVATQPTFAFGNAVAVPRSFLLGSPQARRAYDILPDGKFVGLVQPGQTSSITSADSQIQVVLNWFEELKQRAPAAR